MSGKDNLRACFTQYASLVRKTFQERQQSNPRLSRLRLAYDHLLASIVEALETRREFQSFAEEVEPYLTRPGALFLALRGSGYSYGKESLRHFLRRSGFYHEVFHRKKPKIAKFFHQLSSTLETHTENVRIDNFALISARFDRKTVDLGEMRIQKLTAQKWDAIAQNTIRKTFYPATTINAELLSKHWYLTWNTSRPFDFTGLEFDSPIHRRFPEKPIQYLAAYDWLKQPKQPFPVGSLGFLAPFSFSLDHELFHYPVRPHQLCQVDEFPETIFDQDEYYGSTLRKGHIELLRNTIELIRDVHSRNASGKWEFVDLALGYLAKALLTEDRLEQVLWNVCVLEALLGHAQRTSSIRNRLAFYFAQSADERDNLRRKFRQVYEIRCDLVHSNSFRTAPTLDAVVSARDLARQALVKFFKIIVDEKLSAEKLPKRADVLNWLDKKFGVPEEKKDEGL